MTQPTFVGAALATANFSTTISRVLTGVTAGNTLIAAYSANPQVLSTVSVGTTGNITFAALGTAPVAGSTMNVAGAAGGTGAITSPAYSNPTNYLVAASPSPTVTSCTLLTLASGAVTSTAGTLTMTFALNGAPSISDGDGAYTIFYGPNFSTGSNFGNWALGWRTATSTGSHTITGSNASTVNQTQNMIVMAYSGGNVDSVGASINGTFSASGTGANIGSSGNILPSQSNCTIVGIGWAVQNLNTILVGTSPIAYVNEFNTTASWMIEDFAQGSAASIATNFGLSGGNTNDTIQAIAFAIDSFSGAAAPVPFYYRRNVLYFI